MNKTQTHDDDDDDGLRYINAPYKEYWNVAFYIYTYYIYSKTGHQQSMRT